MPYQHILVPVDGSPTSYVAIQQTAEIAKKFNSKVTAVCVLAIDPFIGIEFVTKEMIEQVRKEAAAQVQKVLDEAKQRFAAAGIEVETQLIEGQEIDQAIVHAATELKADLVVIGSHGRKGFKKLVLGSVAQSILGQIHLPVLVVRG